MKFCEYGCGQEAKYPFKNGKWCCSESFNRCLINRKKNRESNKGKFCSEDAKRKISESHTGKIISEETKRKMSKAKKGKIISEETKRKMSKAKKGKKRAPHSEKTKRKISEEKKYTLKDYKEKHPFLCTIEELKETKNGEIQVHCKNHECENSKEKNGWFTPTYTQLYERIRQLESKEGVGGSYFYCSQHCKDSCILYNLKGDPCKDTNKPYTSEEINIFNKFILNRDNEICYYCREHANTVHHLRPQKLEPFFALDPDYAISVCAKCHYKYGHPTGSEYSTGNLAKIVCSVESQKFLNQK